MGRTPRSVLLGACLAAIAATSVAAQEQVQPDQYALLAPRRRTSSDEDTTTAAPTSAASEMTLSPTTAESTTVPDASMPAPEIPQELQEQAQEIPIAPKGFTGQSSFPRSIAQDDFIPIPDRWRIGFPTGYRDNVGGFGHIWDPYNQNVLKGDYPIIGNDIFLNLTGTSDTLFEARRLPTPSGVSAREPNSIDFFGSGRQFFINQNLILSAAIFKGDAGYRPIDWQVRITPVINYNYVQLEEVGLVDVDVSHGRYRHDNWIGFQEAFFEARLPYESRNFDFTSVRVGIQPFQADFKGFLYSDNNLGVRIFGNKDNNRIQYNLAWFHQIEKDTNSGLNSYTLRNQDIFIANVFFQDSLKYFKNHSTDPKLMGLTTEFTFAANIDNSGQGIQKDDNGFIVRPQPIGTIHDKDVRAYYLGFGTDGHIGRYNLSTQFYEALGTESYNAIAGRGTNINAQFFSVEGSYDQDWIRYRASFAYASGDHDPTDKNANGFDSIFDNPNFAGGGLNFFTRQAIALTGAGVNLVQRNSFLPDLRTSKEQGQANFVNPGLLLYNVGADFDITPKVKLITNVSYLQFVDTKSLQLVLFDDKIGRNIGIDYSAGVEYRPFLNNNVIVIVGAALLQPMGGYRDLFQDTMQYSVFTSLTLTY
jgi:hypothetical protein